MERALKTLILRRGDKGGEVERSGDMGREPMFDGVANEAVPQEVTFKLRTE